MRMIRIRIMIRIREDNDDNDDNDDNNDND